jgi:hypothetical protein
MRCRPRRDWIGLHFFTAPLTPIGLRNNRPQHTLIGGLGV